MRLESGLHRLRLLIDAAEFDWERLYLPMHEFGNSGQRTGPWDFDFSGHAQPLLPGWWLEVDGQRRGLVLAARPGEAQIRTRRLEATGCFAVSESGSHILSLIPHNADGVRVTAAVLMPARDRDPADIAWKCPPASANLGAARVRAGRPAAWWAHATRGPLSALTARLLDSARETAERARQTDPARDPFTLPAGCLPLLALAGGQGGDAVAQDLVLDLVRQAIAAPAWGSSRPDSYIHNADLVAAELIEGLSHLLHLAEPALRNAALWSPLLDCLVERIEQFITQALIWDGYWGGSILQDHGWRSMARLGVAAANLLGLTDRAPQWFAFAAAHVERALEAWPRDGSIPATSYHKLQLFTDDLVRFRAALLQVEQRDLFTPQRVLPIVRFIANRLDEPSMRLHVTCPRGDTMGFCGGWGFLAAVAEEHGDALAAALAWRLVKHYEMPDRNLGPTQINSWLDVLEHAEGLQHASPQTPLAPEPFDLRDETGLAHYRHAETDVSVSVILHSDPPASAARRSACPCDRLVFMPMAGHFTVAFGGRALLVTAEGGYRMQSALSSALLIDGSGSFGDYGSPMAVPDSTPRNTTITAARYHRATAEADLHLDLVRAYRRELQLQAYTRTFRISPAKLVMTDCVVSNLPHTYGWHFHTWQSTQIRQIGSTTFELDHSGRRVRLEGGGDGASLQVTVEPVEVVWAYGHEQPETAFQRIAFSLPAGAGTCLTWFRLDWA